MRKGKRKKSDQVNLEMGLWALYGCVSQYPLCTYAISSVSPYLDWGQLVRDVDHMDGDVDVLIDVHPSPATLTASVKHSDKKLGGGGGTAITACLNTQHKSTRTLMHCTLVLTHAVELLSFKIKPTHQSNGPTTGWLSRHIKREVEEAFNKHEADLSIRTEVSVIGCEVQQGGRVRGILEWSNVKHSMMWKEDCMRLCVCLHTCVSGLATLCSCECVYICKNVYACVCRVRITCSYILYCTYDSIMQHVRLFYVCVNTVRTS